MSSSMVVMLSPGELACVVQAQPAFPFGRPILQLAINLQAVRCVVGHAFTDAKQRGLGNWWAGLVGC